MSLRSYLIGFPMLAAAASSIVRANIPVDERNALLALYASTNGSDWTINTGWNGEIGGECGWYGVFCDNTSTHVTDILLDNNNLVGTLPSLADLSSLFSLQARQNQLSGSIPDLAELTSLSIFFLSGNQLTGSIPSLNGLDNLSGFDVSSNQLTGPIPSLEGLTNLTDFIVSSNRLTGEIPSLSGLGNLFYFDVSYNELTGEIPSLTGLTRLSNFIVGSNQLTGPIPDLSGLTQAYTVLQFGSNHLSGALPTAPPNLFAPYSTLCPNDFPESSYVDNAAWDTATGNTPWYTSCEIIFVDGFELP